MKQLKSNKNIIIVAGGTGGHIYPAITIGEYLIPRYLNVSFITDKRGLMNSNLAKLKPTLINVKGFYGKTIIQKFISIYFIITSFFKSLIFLLNKKADIILGFGSYVQVPVILAAKILNIKIILHEANLVLGNANRYLWSFAEIRSSAFKIINSSKNYQVVGMPVRKQIVNLSKRTYKVPNKNQKINLLILGGSLGSQILSRNVSEQVCFLPEGIKRRLNIIHQSKAEDIEYIQKKYKKNNIKFEVKPYFHDIHKKLINATLVICRAGASTIAENLISGLPAIYIPLSNSVGNHQHHNAEMMQNYNTGRIILENEVFQKKFIKLLFKLLNSKDLLEKISSNCKKISYPNAPENLYKLVLGVLNE